MEMSARANMNTLHLYCSSNRIVLRAIQEYISNIIPVYMHPKFFDI